MQTPLFTPEQRQRAVALVVALTANTRLAPKRYERRLLERFEQGELTLDQMSDLLEASVHQVLYHSRATTHATKDELHTLLAQSCRHNAAHGITGLLLYSEGRFVQVLEGEEPAVNALYARIRQDWRHEQVTTVSQGPGPRLFAEWSMAFGHVPPAELDQALRAVQGHATGGELAVGDPHLCTLLRAFA